MNPAHFQIILADDDLDDCMFFEEALNEFPISIHLSIIHNGEKLMQHLLNNSEQLPDLLFLDLNMPRKNGFECLAEIKQNEKLKHLPVIIISTSMVKDVVNLLYKNGAQYFIRKPGEFSQFKKVIHHSLTKIIRQTPLQPTKEEFVLSQ